MFMTRADRAFPLWFGKPITIAFYDQMIKKRLSSSNSSLQLNLPYGENVNAFDEFFDIRRC